MELALFLPLLLLLTLGVASFSSLYVTSEQSQSATADAARYGSLHPANVSNTTPPAAESIQGIAYFDASIPPDDLILRYYTPNTTLCGTYTASAGFVGSGTNTLGSCSVAGNFLRITTRVPAPFFDLINPEYSLSVSFTTEMLIQ